MKIDIERLMDLSGKVAIVTGGGDGIGLDQRTDPYGQRRRSPGS